MRLFPKITAFLVLETIFVTLAAGVFGYMFVAHELSQNVQGQQLQIVSDAMQNINRLIYQRSNDISVIAVDKTIVDFLNSKPFVVNKPLASQLRNFTFLTGPWDDLDIVSNAGVIRSSSAA